MVDRTDWHGTAQDVFDEKMDVLTGYKVLEAEREERTYIHVDYFVELDLDNPYDGPIQEGIRPFARAKRYNSFEIKSFGDTLNENLFRKYSARGLLKAHIKGGLAAKGNATLYIVVANKPIKLLRVSDYEFSEVTSWMFQSNWIGGLDIYIIVLPGLREIDGGEPMAYLQALEGNPKHQKKVWSRILRLDTTGKRTLESTILKIDVEGYMSSIADDIELKGELKGKLKGELKSLKESVRLVLAIAPPSFQNRFKAQLKKATSVETLATLQKNILRELSATITY